MVEPGQLHGDPSRKALWNWLPGYGKAGRTGNPITCWAIAALGENPLAGSRGQNPPSVGLGGNTQGSHLSCYRGTLEPSPFAGRDKGVGIRKGPLLPSLGCADPRSHPERIPPYHSCVEGYTCALSPCDE
jgi:hypothetical protein